MINLDTKNTISSPALCKGLYYNSETATLQGVYGNELAMQRAKKGWKDVFAEHFMLEHNSDYRFTAVRDYESNTFTLICTFESACARYALWRIANYQAPETQYALETAHIPKGKDVSETDIFPELISDYDSPCFIGGNENFRNIYINNRLRTSMRALVLACYRRLRKIFRKPQ